MKKLLFISIIFLSMMTLDASAQHRTSASEQHGQTFNLGVGIGYYGYVDHSVPVIMMNYEFDVARNFTLAPFVGIYSYTNDYYWDNGYYRYRETTIPLGVKASYYLDELLAADSDWDFYVAASLGAQIHSESWDNGYGGDRSVARDTSPLYLDAHVGARYHISRKVGIFLDLSTGVSTLGLSF